MITADKNYVHSEVTEQIIGCAYDVYKQLGFGFAEKVYENAMMIKLRQKELEAVQQAPINVLFEANLVGEYYADILVRTYLKICFSFLFFFMSFPCKRESRIFSPFWIPAFAGMTEFLDMRNYEIGSNQKVIIEIKAVATVSKAHEVF